MRRRIIKVRKTIPRIKLEECLAAACESYRQHAQKPYDPGIGWAQISPRLPAADREQAMLYFGRISILEHLLRP